MQEQQYRELGYTVLRDAIEENVLRQVENPIYRAYEAGNHATVDAQPGTPGSAIARATRACLLQRPHRGKRTFSPALVAGSLVSVSLLNLHVLLPS